MKRGVTVFLAVLIMLIPVAAAAELSNLQVRGEDNVDGYYRSQDKQNVTVNAVLENDPGGIQPDQLRIYVDGVRKEPFERCIRTTGLVHECVWDKGFVPFPGEHDYEIRLYSDANKNIVDANPSATAESVFIFDSNPPSIESFDITPEVSPDGKITLAYNAHDRAYGLNDDEHCSGLARIEFALQSTPDTPFTTAIISRDCDKQGSLEYTLVGIPDGEHTVIAKAFDALGQPSFPITTTFMLDATDPVIDSSNIRVYRTLDGTDVEWVRSGQDIEANLEVLIDDPFLTSVHADLTKLSTRPGMGNVAGDIQDGVVLFDHIRLTGFQQCKITITAKDQFDHTTVKTVDCNTGLDNSKPVLQALRTGRQDAEGNYIVGVKTKVTAEISDTGSGVSNNSILLDLRSITGEVQAAESCTKSGETYTCEWTVTPERVGGVEEISIHPTSMDLAGNTIMAGAARLSLTINMELPMFGVPELKPLAGGEVGVPAFVNGGGFALRVPIQNHDPEGVEVDLRNIGGEVEQMDCSESECTFIGDIAVSGPSGTNITVIAKSVAQNPAEMTIPLDIMAYLEGEPAYWTPSLKCSPSSVDRQSASLIEHQVFCDLDLQGAKEDWYPLAVRFDNFRDCTDLPGVENLKYVDDITMYNKQSGDTHPTFAITLVDTDYPMDSISFQCAARIYTASRHQLEVNPNPEVENITITIPFYNQALGDVYEGLDAQVEAAVADAKSNMEFVSKLQKFFAMAEKLCDFKQTLASIAGTIDTVTIWLGITDDGLGRAVPGVNAARVGLCGKSNFFNDLFYNEQKIQKEKLKPGGPKTKTVSKGGFPGFLNKMCAFVNCRAGEEEGMGGVLRTIGGDSGKACKWAKNFFGKIGGVEGFAVTDQQKALHQYDSKYADTSFQDSKKRPATLNIKESIILSSMCLCVPGIIYNLNKLREIECQKALCMKSEVRDKGLPPTVCNDLEGYLKCNFIVGDVFSLFPPARVWSQVTDLLSTVLANPVELFQLYSGFVCRGMCPAKADKYLACRIPKTLSKLGDAIVSFTGIGKVKDFRMTPTSGSCDELEDAQ